MSTSYYQGSTEFVAELQVPEILNGSSRYPGSPAATTPANRTAASTISSTPKAECFRANYYFWRCFPGEKPTPTAGLRSGLENLPSGSGNPWDLTNLSRPELIQCWLCRCSEKPGTGLGRVAALLGIIKIYQSAHQLSKVNQKPTPPAEPHFPPHCPFKHPLLFPFTSSPPTLRQKFLHCAGRRNGSKIQKEHPPI